MVVSSVKEIEMKKWLAALLAAGVLFVGGFGQASAADWYYIDADADDAAWFIDNSSVYKTDDAATVLVKLDTTVYSAAGVALLSSKDAQKPTKIEDDTMGAEVMKALWGK